MNIRGQSGGGRRANASRARICHERATHASHLPSHTHTRRQRASAYSSVCVCASVSAVVTDAVGPLSLSRCRTHLSCALPAAAAGAVACSVPVSVCLSLFSGSRLVFFLLWLAYMFAAAHFASRKICEFSATATQRAPHTSAAMTARERAALHFPISFQCLCRASMQVSRDVAEGMRIQLKEERK